MSDDKGLTYKLAELCHEQWSGWMGRLFKFGTFNEDGSFTITAEKAQRWLVLMTMHFDDLSRENQEIDLYEASRIQELLGEHFISCDHRFAVAYNEMMATAETYRQAGLGGIAETLDKFMGDVMMAEYLLLPRYFHEKEDGR
jgi:hypothetical protein